MSVSEVGSEIPHGNVRGFVRFFKSDVLSGFLVFLIALPLCLGISLASGYPPLAGIFTAIIGAIVTTFLSNSELTIKGPAAGLIVIVIGCVQEFGGDGVGAFTETDMVAYKMALAVGVAAAVLQIAFGLFRGGILGDFFPVTPVHGMLAAIGVIIISKQVPVALGITGAKGEPLHLLAMIPEFIRDANPAIAAIGIISTSIMFLWPLVGTRIALLKHVPSPLIVLFVAIPLGMYFDLLHKHDYVLQNHKYQLSEQYLVNIPEEVFGMFSFITFPDFTALTHPMAWKWVMMFFIIGSLESMLSAKAIDLLDPYKRKTNLNRDLSAVGVANLLSSLVGGLPMISEIVRSRANIDNGAKTRFANMWHGIFLLACAALIPMALHRIPSAALAGMLIYTGFRLAHPREFVNVYQMGREQLLIFVTTIIAVLATDLLIGIAIGIGLKLFIHVANGAPIHSLFKPYLEVEQSGDHDCIIRAHESAVFSNWIPFRRQIEDLGLVQRQNIVLDLSHTKLVDHSVMEKLHEMQMDFEQNGLTLEIVGLEGHEPVASHQYAARRGKMSRLRRLTIIGESSAESTLIDKCLELGASGYTSIPCTGASLRGRLDGKASSRGPQFRLEIITPVDVCDRILTYLRQEVLAKQRVVVFAEWVEVLRRDHFVVRESASVVERTSHQGVDEEAGRTRLIKGVG